MLERSFSDQQLCGFLILMDLSQSNSPWPESPLFLLFLWWCLTWSFHSNVLWSFCHPTSCFIHPFSCSLLCSGHFECWLKQSTLWNDCYSCPFEKVPGFSEMLAPNWSKMWSAYNITCQSKFKAVAGQALFPGASH